MKILIINGPNLNLLGARETSVYGTETFESYLSKLRALYSNIEFEYYQSNVEGELINKIQQADQIFQGIILNAAGYTHTSVALGDTVKSLKTPVVEVHISNIHAREEFRSRSMISEGMRGIVIGFGLDSYRVAIEYFLIREA
jgi:3-dehydroquinate dehydratase II